MFLQKNLFVGNSNAKYKIAVLDLGIKKNILKCLVERDCYLKVFPMNTKYSEIKEWNPDGYFLSNGPGDPSAMPEIVNEVKKSQTMVLQYLEFV